MSKSETRHRTLSARSNSQATKTQARLAVKHARARSLDQLSHQTYVDNLQSMDKARKKLKRAGDNQKAAIIEKQQKREAREDANCKNLENVSKDRQSRIDQIKERSKSRESAIDHQRSLVRENCTVKKIQGDMRAFDVAENREILRRQKQAD